MILESLRSSLIGWHDGHNGGGGGGGGRVDVVLAFLSGGAAELLVFCNLYQTC